jgi:hypothetical protein
MPDFITGAVALPFKFQVQVGKLTAFKIELPRTYFYSTSASAV